VFMTEASSFPPHSPPPIFADTSDLRTKKTEGQIVLSSATSSEKLQISGELAKTNSISRLIKGNKQEQPTFAKIKNDVVLLNVQEGGGGEKIVKIKVKIKDLAKLLGSTREQLKELSNEGVLGEFLSGRMQGKIIQQEFSHETRNENIKDYHLKPADIKKLDDFYDQNKNLLDSLTEPMLIHRDKDDLPFSVVFVPNEPGKGMYVLLKTHQEKIGEIGVGSYNRATLAIKWDTGEKKVFRNARSEDVKENEIEANKLTMKDSKHFSSGIPVVYRGDWRARRGREKDVDLSSVSKHTNIEKLGFIMDYEEGGDLFDYINAVFSSNQPPPQKKTQTMAQEYAESLSALHKIGLVHQDQKPENAFLTKDGHIKIADFGLAFKPGEEHEDGGSPGYMAPETILDREEATFSSDVWQMGCVFALMFGQYDWTAKCKFQDWDVGVDYKYGINFHLEDSFPKSNNPKHPDYIIARCLNPIASERPTSEEVAKMWENLNTKGKATA
jgi:serine/threonine protein kinase